MRVSGLIQILDSQRVNSVNFVNFSFSCVGFKIKKENISALLLVEMKGFEPPTLWSQTRCANRTALHLDC